MENSYSFTSREKEVIELLLKGKSNNQIAQALSISTSTVEFHLRNVYGKLGVNSRTEAVLRLSEYSLGKSIGNFSEKLTESVVDEGINAADNDGQTTAGSRSMPMKNIKYIVGGLFALLIITVLFAYSQSKNIASASIVITNTASQSIVVSASPTPKIVSCSLIHEVTFCVKGMALTDDFTYVMLEIKAPPTIQPDMMGFMLPSALDSEIRPTLKDNLGNEYQVVDDQSLMAFPGSDQQTYQQTLKFPQIDKEAQSATLSFPTIVTSSTVESSILLDLGENPQPGQVISLDQTLSLQGQKIQLTRAELSGDGINSLHIDILSDPVELTGNVVGLMLSLGIPEGTNMGTGFGSKMILPDLPYHAFAELTRPGTQPVSGLLRNRPIRLARWSQTPAENGSKSKGRQLRNPKIAQKDAFIGQELNANQAFSHQETPFCYRAPLLRRGWRKLDEIVAVLRCPLAHVFDLLFFVLLLILVHTQWIIFHLILQHPVHHTRNRIGRRHRRLRWPQPGPQPPVEHSKRAICLFHRLRCHPECLPSPILRFQGLIVQYLPTRNLMLGRQSQPRAIMLLGRELAHVRPTFQYHRLRQRYPHSIHQADIHPADAFQVRTDFRTLRIAILTVRTAFVRRYHRKLPSIPIWSRF